MSKIWETKVTEEDGKIKVERTNDGFTAFELLGIIESFRHDILMQIHGEIKPEIVRKHIDRE